MFFIPIQACPAGEVQEGALKKRNLLLLVKTRRMSRKWTRSNKSLKAYVQSSRHSNIRHKRTHRQSSKVKPTVQLTRGSSKTTKGREVLECTLTITSHPRTIGAVGTRTTTTVIRGNSSTGDTSPMVEGCIIIHGSIQVVMVWDTRSGTSTKVASNMATAAPLPLLPLLLSKVRIDRTTPAVVNSIRAAVAAAIIPAARA